MRYERRRRVVITGMGVIAPNGRDLGTFWESIREGKSAAAPLTRFDTANYPSQIAAEVRGFNIGDYADAKRARRFSLAIQYAIAAAKNAMTDAGADFHNCDANRMGVVEATSVTGMETLVKGLAAFEARGYRTISPFTLINTYAGGGSGEIAIELGIRGHAATYCTGSASGNDVIGYGARMIRDDDLDLVVAGGAEAPILAPLWGAFCQTKVMTTRDGPPGAAMRPFDTTRDGFLLGEGAAFVVLEELTHALSRGARIYAEVAGHGSACEAYHSVAPHPDGIGLCRAMEKAMRSAGLSPGAVSYVNAHGTATEANDMIEGRAIEKFFNGSASRIAVSATKPVTGHLLAAAGALETIISALAIHHQTIPQTANLGSPAPELPLDFVRGQSRPYPVRVAMNLSVGFGGKNACLVLQQYDGHR